MVTKEAGRIVWHDLFTADKHVSKSFYERVAGWHYVTEHAKNFVWGGGEKDFVLALCGDEAGAGMIDQSSAPFDGWIPYVEVQDVDSVAALATESGGKVIRPPFDVPGVGRNCLLLDPLGAHLGISFSRHKFPVPVRQFTAERY
ncbi:MAG: VOC family protein, partial [Geminicoccaceae bacterium]